MLWMFEKIDDAIDFFNIASRSNLTMYDPFTGMKTTYNSVESLVEAGMATMDA